MMILFTCTGATCLPKRPSQEFKPQQLFQTPPSVEELSNALNRSNAIFSIQSNSVSVKVNRELTLNADLTWLRPTNFRMSGTIAGFKGFDLGSNDESFWMSFRNGMTPTLVYARHDQFDALTQRRVLPVSPIWLIEALGINPLDPYQLVQSPVSRPDGLWELTTVVPGPAGNYTRTLVVEPLYGLTKQVYLRDPSGTLVANAFQSNHEYYGAVQTSLPHKVIVQLIPGFNDPPIELDLTIGSYVVNGMTETVGNQFAFPNANGYKQEDIVNLASGGPNAVTMPQVTPPDSYPYSNYRGVPWDGATGR